MTSFELNIDPKSRAAGRFIAKVRKALTTAALDEKKRNGLNQRALADALGVNRSVVNRLLRGQENLTLRSVAEVAWALGLEPDFQLLRAETPHQNVKPPAHVFELRANTAGVTSQVFSSATSAKSSRLTLETAG